MSVDLASPGKKHSNGSDRDLVEQYAEADIPTALGPLHVIVFRERHGGKSVAEREHVAIVVGSPLERPDDVLVRIHSECLTSEVFGSLKCDCRAQLDAAIARVRANGSGGIICYLRQEGRGIGLGNKIRAYQLQAQGVDTVDANHQLGFEADLRTYDVAGAMLQTLGVRGVSIMTNNPAKIAGLEQCGINIVRRVALEIPPTLHSADYLATKQRRLGHLLGVLSPLDEIG
jgi:GTP cyclohydrolase II/3,4-dihydroxy 2-butanone 4-phosphate synthase/GTP cyclohydrolase II